MDVFLFYVSLFIDIGIIFHIMKYLPTISVHFLVSFKTGRRILKLTAYGRPIFSQEKYQKRGQRIHFIL